MHPTTRGLCRVWLFCFLQPTEPSQIVLLQPSVTHWPASASEGPWSWSPFLMYSNLHVCGGGVDRDFCCLSSISGMNTCQVTPGKAVITKLYFLISLEWNFKDTIIVLPIMSPSIFGWLYCIPKVFSINLLHVTHLTVPPKQLKSFRLYWGQCP